MLLAASPAEAGSPRSHALQLAPEWEQAAQRAKERRAAWREVFESLEADPAECEAVVFPELLRYSRVQDGVEQAALLALYVQGGKAKGRLLRRDVPDEALVCRTGRNGMDAQPFEACLQALFRHG